MSISTFSPQIPQNIVWGPALYNALNTSQLNNVANQYKSLYLDGSNITQWGSNGVQQPVITDSNGLIPTNLIPQTFDEIREYANVASFPLVGDGATGILYYATDTGFFYKWNVSAYINISTINFYNKTQIDGFLNSKLNLSGGTVSGSLNMGTNNISNAGIIGCTNMNALSLSVTGLYDVLSALYITLSGNVITAGKPISMGSNEIYDITTITTGTTRQYQINSQANNTRSMYFENSVTYYDKQTNHNGHNISNAGTIGCTNLNALSLSATGLYDVLSALYITFSGNVITAGKPISMASNAISGISTLSATTSNLGSLGSGLNLNSQTLSNGGIINCTNMTCANIATTSLYDIVGNPYAVLSGNIITASKPLAMGSNSITGITIASGTTSNFSNVGGFTATGAINMNSNAISGISTLNGQTMTGFINIGQLIFSITNGIQATGVRNYVVGNVPNATNPLWLGGASVYMRNGVGATVFRSVPEYGTTLFDNTPAQNWELRLDTTTDDLTLHIPDIARLSDFFNLDNELYCKVYFNLA